MNSGVIFSGVSGQVTHKPACIVKARNAGSKKNYCAI